VAKAAAKASKAAVMTKSSTRKSSKKEEALPPSFHPFDPIIDESSRILILGTFPSVKSFENAFYYGHPQNQFWKLLSTIFQQSEPKTNEEKIAFLKRYKIALWDMVKSCQREGSLDSALKNVEVNDIEDLLKRYSNIEAIFFTGRKAQQLYERHFSHLQFPTYYLPSPSPANRSKSFEEKLREWSILTDYLRSSI
jgi:hypoxanthine-DNA glycosylase